MTVAVKKESYALLDRLPKVRGRLTAQAPLGHMTWFGVGGCAEVLFKPADSEDLCGFLADLPADIPVTALGVSSNVIVRDGGIPGVVIRLGREFADVRREPDALYAGSAALDMNVALFALKNNLSGLEFFSGIPGTIGGALRMNAGAYGQEMKDVLIAADYVSRDGQLYTVSPQEMDMTYRHNVLPSDVVFVGARLRTSAGDAREIEKRMAEIKSARAASQPIKSKTGGSTFANPEGAKSWELIDRAGMRGACEGGAQMSELHCNFMINTGNATAADLERLGEKVRQKVFQTSGVMLRWEIKRIGVPLEKDRDLLELK